MLNPWRRVVTLTAVWLVGVAGCDPQPTRVVSAESNGATFSIMTWNLEWFYDEHVDDNYSQLAKEKSAPSRHDWEWRRDAVAASIAKVRPTVCAFQEVESRRVLWYLTRSLLREHAQSYQEVGIESADVFTEQDVGFLYRRGADLLSTTVFSPTAEMRDSDQFYNVAKHVLAVFQVPTGEDVERVVVMNVHLRATAQAADIRTRQARLLRHWIDDTVAAGDNVIMLGDFNTESSAAAEKRNAGARLGELEVARGWESSDPADDWVDLHAYLDPPNRQTHLIRGRAFDRILVSQSLIEDDPDRRDLVLASVKVRRDLAVRGSLDDSSLHWDHYWSLAPEERDLSDHFPVLATFNVQ